MATRSVKLSEYRDPKPWAHQLKRALWYLVQFPFWVRIPRVLNPVRIALLRLFGAQIGRNCLVGSARVWIPWNLRMGEFSVIGDSVEIYNLAPVHIGANCVVSQRTYLCTATHDYQKPHFPIYSRPINIDSSAWIAASAFLAPGISVGEGAVVGACSVVTTNVPPWTVCAGNPCRVIKERRMDEPHRLPNSRESLEIAETRASSRSRG